MTFTKDQMQTELLSFLVGYGKQISSLFRLPDEWVSESKVQDTPVWIGANEMYDYGVAGIPASSVEPGVLVARHERIEKFLFSLDSPPMRTLLYTDRMNPPDLAIIAAKIASARMVLEGRNRYTDPAAETTGLIHGTGGYLTIADIALLANMDERSVRNAANPKLPDALKTIPVGRRALVEPEEAKRWLGGRKGFVPTQGPYIDPERDLPSYDLPVSVEFIEDVEREARELGVPLKVHFETRVLEGVVNAMKDREAQKNAGVKVK